MRLLLKLITAPIVLALALIVWGCSGLLYCSSLVLGLVSTVLSLLAFLVLFTTSVQNGLILLFLAFLVGPLGLPMCAAWLLGKLQQLRYAIQDLAW